MVDAGGRVRWRAPAGELVAFSPSGTKVLASSAGRRIAVLRGRDGSTVASIDLPAGVEQPVVWETDRTLLALMTRGDRAAIVRVHLNGRVQRVTPVARLVHGQSPYVLV